MAYDLPCRAPCSFLSKSASCFVAFKQTTDCLRAADLRPPHPPFVSNLITYVVLVLSKKTSLFKWKPEWEEAGTEYDKAGQCFKLAKDYGKMMEVYVLAAAAHTEATDLYHAGKAYENAGEAARDMKNPKKSIELLKAASQM